MYSQYIPLTKPIDLKYLAELEKRLFYVSADIIDFEIKIQNEHILGVELTTAHLGNAAELTDKVNRVVDGDVAIQKVIPVKTIWEAEGKAQYKENVFAQLIDRGMAHVAGEGQVTLSEPLISLMDALDTRIKDIALTQFGAKEYRYPTLIPTQTLADCGYFESFPHMIMFVTRLHNDVDTYHEFADSYQAQKNIGAYALNYCQNLDYCLPPTMCYHTYHQHRGKQFENGETLVITSRGKSFRYEGNYHHSLERLWDFTIREIVFLGNEEFVLECRQKFMQASFALMEELNLTGHAEVANDPFFTGLNALSKMLNQRIMEMKYELRLKLDENHTIAVGSFNFHDQFFGKGFNMTQDTGSWLKSGCVGFGLERLTFAFLCHHGLDPQHWPQVLP